jgi:peroxiredoxin
MEKYDGIHRTTFVIDENGIIDEVIDKVKTKASYRSDLEVNFFNIKALI